MWQLSSLLFPFRILSLAFSILCLPLFLHSPPQTSLLPVLFSSTNPLWFPLSYPARATRPPHPWSHTALWQLQPFHLHIASCFPDTISHAASSAPLTLQYFLFTFESRKHHVQLRTFHRPHSSYTTCRQIFGSANRRCLSFLASSARHYQSDR